MNNYQLDDEDVEVTEVEQIFHNNIREQIVSFIKKNQVKLDERYFNF